LGYDEFNLRAISRPNKNLIIAPRNTHIVVYCILAVERRNISSTDCCPAYYLPLEYRKKIMKTENLFVVMWCEEGLDAIVPIDMNIIKEEESQLLIARFFGRLF